ncbi:aminoglycoside phosphotransferase family protein [Streptomyces sp. NBC_00306]|uniref:aminoglycoside phosphotransferase family protein n=1 Tax=Streptomyces sp. NBC_00306 TaxID=2975708 RepID=UPI002E2BBC2E|nr:aminoglycoside phosphotransferase family protein [Streptomyces sp. NBC_00306]
MGFEAPRRLVRALGESDDWLGLLPALTDEAVSREGLDVERVMAPGGRSSLVVLVRLEDGTPAALKLAPPAATPALERAALEHWDGWGAVRLLAAPGDALLLERLHPEMSLRSLPEAKALLEASGIVRRLWVEPPAGHGFESVADRTARQAEAMRVSAEASSDASSALVSEALAARDELTAAPPETLLLHGNFRQGKVLAGDRTPWLAVGPEPLVGERAYDLARLVRDRVEDLIAASSGASAARRRVNKLADSLEVDPDRLRGWTLFRAVESATRAQSSGRAQEAELSLEFASWL